MRGGRLEAFSGVRSWFSEIPHVRVAAPHSVRERRIDDEGVAE